MVAKSVISITQDAIPDVLPGSTRTINFTMDTNGTEPAGARLEALMVDDVKVTHMTNYPPAKLLINDAGTMATVISSSDIPTEWTKNRTITVVMPESVSTEGCVTIGSLTHFNADDVRGLSTPLKVQFSGVPELPVEVRFMFKAKWQDWESKGWLYSYDIFVRSTVNDIRKWKISFSNLPTDTQVGETWAQVNHDGQQGVVELQTPDGGYMLEVGKELPISIQLLYPATAGAQEQFETLWNLGGYDLTN